MRHVNAHAIQQELHERVRRRAEGGVAYSTISLLARIALSAETQALHEMSGHHPAAPCCEFCIRGKGTEDVHRHAPPNSDPSGTALPIVAFDVMFFSAEDDLRYGAHWCPTWW